MAEAESRYQFDPAAGELTVQPDITDVKTPEEAAALPGGTRFRDPTGKVRIVPHKVEKPEDVYDLPDEAQFTDPGGTLRTAPKYEGLNFSAQALYNMAGTEHGREEVLKRFYEGSDIKRSTKGDLIVKEKNGTYRRSGASRGIPAALGVMASQTAPAIGTVGGGALGAVGGGVGGGGVGAVPGGAAGAVLGAMGGEAFNHMIVGLAGIHDRSMTEQLYDVGMSGASAAAGEGAGRAIAAAPKVAELLGSAKAAGNKLSNMTMEGFVRMLEAVGITPERARYIIGAEMPDVERALRLSKGGAKVPVSSYAKEAPMLRKVQEEFDPQFRRQNVIAEANRDYYEKEGAGILQSLPKSGGAEPTSLDTLTQTAQPLTRATTKVSSEEAGKLAIQAARVDMAHADAQLEAARVEMRRAIEGPAVAAGGIEGLAAKQDAAVRTLQEMQKQAIDAAENAVKKGAKLIQDGVDRTIAKAAEGENTGDLWRSVAQSFRQFNASIRLRAKGLYDAARDAAGDVIPPKVDSLLNDAQGFMKSIPQGLRDKYPHEIRMLAKLAGEVEEVGIEDAAPLNWVDLHQLRSWLRHGVDYTDLTPDMRAGSLKLFADKVDKVLHDPNAPRELLRAAKLLDQADGFYKKNIPFLNDQMVTSVMKGVESGVANDPTALAETLFQPGRTEAMARAKKIMGANLWNAVTSADTQVMLDASKTLTGEFDGQSFARQVLDRKRNGILDVAYNQTQATKLEKLAKQALMLEGKIPISPQDGDTVGALLTKAADYAARAEKLAKEDPLRVLNAEMKALNKSFSEMENDLRTQLKRDPLHFLATDNMSGMAVKAADRILQNEDLIRAAATQFGANSPEFNALRQVYVWRKLQRPFGRVAGMREEFASEAHGITEETQSLMFPGITRQSMDRLITDMEFLFGDTATDVGGSMAAASRVINPQSALPIPMPHGIWKLPGAIPAARFALGKYFAAISEGLTNPVWFEWLAGKLGGNEVDRAAAREAFQQGLKLGGWYGAGGAVEERNRRRAENPL